MLRLYSHPNSATLICLLVLYLYPSQVVAATGMEFGFAKVDVTPTEPVRLSGYGNRSKPMEGVDEQLFARAMALRHGSDRVHLLVSVDTIGLPAALSQQIFVRLKESHQLDRSQLVLCGTHTHTGPHLDLVNMLNLFSTPLTEAERAATERYGQALVANIIQACNLAIDDLQPGKMFTAQGTATFATNRRILKDGRCVGMGPNPDGPVDHSLPILKITDRSGETVRGLIFNYACHCTTFGGDHNRVNGDWAGYAAQYLEAEHPGAVALSTIGCGADANPQRNTGHDLEVAQAEGRQIAEEVKRLVGQPMRAVTDPLLSTFGYAGLPIDRPSLHALKEKLEERSPQVRQHAQNMLATHKRMGRLPESYPMPIQVWRFGDQLTMIFFGGEVCVDYALRSKREFHQTTVWVSAYANDLFGYVAPERMQGEGGYEVDSSMIYYNQPGRWSTGTEKIIFRKLHSLADRDVPTSPLSVGQALKTFTVPAGFTVEAVAAEPLLVDPVNFSVGPDGRLWVVEMSDYPRGANDDGQPGGRIKVLADTDGDGQYDQAVLFLDRLTYPTGVLPYRDGALVSCVPDVFMARDTDGDGRADQREVLYSGFSPSNPQHQMSGFTRGLDNWIYLACGDDHGKIRCLKSGQEVSVSGRDARIRPDEGLLQAVSGRSQYGRCRDDWNRWFGNTNGEPLLHFVIDDHYLSRNPFVPAPSPRVAMTDPPVAPPVYPTSRSSGRFNDLFDANRFTSACSPLLFRDTTLGSDVQGAAFICEPVHNLVSRLMLIPQGVTYRGQRHASEQTAEFFSSTDPWCRPVRLATGPDGALWLADMVRQTIEHPEWIPEAWQIKLDLYAGNRHGRIYRIFRTDTPPIEVPDFTRLTSAELVQELGATNGWRRDTAQQLLLERNDLSMVAALETRVASDPRPLARLHALATLDGLDRLSFELLITALSDDDPRVIAWAIVLAEAKLVSHPELVAHLLELANHDDLQVRFQLALTLGELSDRESATEQTGSILLRLALRDPNDPWIRAAVISSSRRYADHMLTELLQSLKQTSTGQASIPGQLLQDLIATSLGEDIALGTARIIGAIHPINETNPDRRTDKSFELQHWQFTALASCVAALQRRNLTWDTIAQDDPEIAAAAQPLFAAARDVTSDEKEAIDRRLAAIELLGSESAYRDADWVLLMQLMSVHTPPVLQQAAVRVLANGRPKDLVQRLLTDWPSRGPQLRSQIIATLLTRGSWVQELMQALSAGTLPTHDLDATSRWRLLGYPHPRVREQALRLFGESSSTSRAEILTAYASAASLTADVDRGKLLFTKTCATCHQHAGVGKDLGPKLAALQDESSEFLMTAILDPNRAIDHKYHAYTVVTQNGLALSGLIIAETANSIELMDAQGKAHTILRIDIEELANSGISFMPVGLEKELTPQDLADIMAFVRSEPSTVHSSGQKGS